MHFGLQSPPCSFESLESLSPDGIGDVSMAEAGAPGALAQLAAAYDEGPGAGAGPQVPPLEDVQACLGTFLADPTPWVQERYEDGAQGAMNDILNLHGLERSAALHAFARGVHKFLNFCGALGAGLPALFALLGYKVQGGSGLGKPPAEMCKAFVEAYKDATSAMRFTTAGAVHAFAAGVRKMAEDPEVRMFVPSSAGPSAEGGGASAAPQFKASLPKLPTVTGTPRQGAGKVDVAYQLVAMIQSAQEQVVLLKYSGRTAVSWAATSSFDGEARVWWLGYAGKDKLQSLDQLLTEAATYLVGPDVYELVVGDFIAKKLTSFRTFESYRVWLKRVEAAMRALARDGRVWGDTVLVDLLIKQVEGTLYHEGLVVDPATLTRPNDWSRALQLLDDRHRVLLGRSQAHNQLSLRDMPPLGDGKGKGKDKERRPAGTDDRPRKRLVPKGGAGTSGGAADPKERERAREEMFTRLAEIYKANVDTIRRRFTQQQCLACNSKEHSHKHCPKGKRLRAEHAAATGQAN